MNNIKKIRKSQNISVTELALKLNMSQSNLTKIENSQIELRQDVAQKIAEALNVSVTALRQEKGEDNAALIELINPESAGYKPMAHISFPFPNASNLPQSPALFAITDDAMEPKINKNAFVLLDKSVTSLNADGIYLIEINAKKIIRRLQNSLNGTIFVIPDNKAYTLEEISPDNLKIIAKATGVLSYITL